MIKYLLFGLGLLHGLRAILLTPLLRGTVYTVSDAACLIAAGFSVKGFWRKKATAGVPEKWRR